jgi:hypothetical protein
MTTSPEVAVSSPAMMLSNVDLPQPEGPTRIRNSPDSISRSMAFSTSTLPKTLRTFLTASEDSFLPFLSPSPRRR